MSFLKTLKMTKIFCIIGRICRR
ncbi:CLUMA_CG019009, isoform A [Clunio marinus]|uniref:CLUMA_CG019009, isoform A n=1 Tax=Clunio marinus TaxID=568069 RepID=A0A1J1J1A6_9DIPT|nr:CLUMA_CG019009, isoform A [Clunio marinus]